MAGLGSFRTHSESPGTSGSGSVRLDSTSRASASRLGLMSYFRPLLLLAIGLLLSGFALTHIRQLDRPFEAVVLAARHVTVPALLSPALCGIAGLAAFLVLLAVHRAIDELFCRLRNTTAASSPSHSDFADQFPVEIASALSAAELPARTLARELSLPTNAQRKAIHTAALLAIESRSLESPTPPGMLRRRSDYEGPRRRSTDGRFSIFYDGPFRRTTDIAADSAADSPVALPQEIPIADSASSEHA